MTGRGFIFSYEYIFHHRDVFLSPVEHLLDREFHFYFYDHLFEEHLVHLVVELMFVDRVD